MAYTTDMFAGVHPELGQAPLSNSIRQRRDFLTGVQPNSEAASFVEQPPANYKEKVLPDKWLPCMPDMVFRH